MKIEITKLNYKDYTSLDIVAFSHSFIGACGEGGAIIMVAADGCIYHTNFVEQHFTEKEIEQICPPIRKCKFGLCEYGEVPHGWHYVDLGMGNHLVVNDCCWSSFEKAIEHMPDVGDIYQNWLHLIQEIVSKPQIEIHIHRGGNQIGGCITEITTAQSRILIDLGSNLPGSNAKELSAEQIAEVTSGADAVFYTHYHGDHVGLFRFVPDSIPQYIGEGALEIMKCKYEVLSRHENKEQELFAINRMKTYQANSPMQIGDIRITPYYCCHSAFDAYMFKIETQGKVILHTGDFRRHGYLGKALDGVLKKYIGQVDILITEGTMLSRSREKVLPESAIQQNAIEVLKRHKYVFALCSSTDMERLASFHAACQKTARVFCCDGYQKSILDVFTKHTEAKLLQFTDTFKLTDYKARNVKHKLKNEGFLMPVRGSQLNLIKAMMQVYDDEPAYLIYSMWQGYHNGKEENRIPAVIEIRKLFGSRIFDGTKDGFHTSGHADVQTLRHLCQLVRPRMGVVFIHKEAQTSGKALHLSSDIHVVEKDEWNQQVTIKLN